MPWNVFLHKCAIRQSVMIYNVQLSTTLRLGVMASTSMHWTLGVCYRTMGPGLLIVLQPTETMEFFSYYHKSGDATYQAIHFAVLQIRILDENGRVP